VGDIDIAVLARTRIPAADRFDVQEQLAARIGRDVDHQTRQDAIILNLAETS
jgi:predicted nucleotidyltransferase